MDPKLGLVHGNQILEIRDLSSAEYQACKEAISQLLQYSSDQALFTITRLNYADYNNTLQQCLAAYVEWSWTNPLVSPPIDEMMLEINRKILNLLSAFRTFVDHSEFRLKKRHGDSSERVIRFKRACSSACDNSFSYRFAYQLRNYAQHCRMPLSGLELGCQIDRSTQQVEYSLAIYFDRDELLSWPKWSSRLKREIQGLPREFAINPHINELMQCIESINLTVTEDDLAELVGSARVIQELVASTKHIPGIPCILREDLSRNGTIPRIEWIPVNVADTVTSATAGA